MRIFKSHSVSGKSGEKIRRKVLTAAGGLFLGLLFSISAFGNDPYDPSSPNYVGNKTSAKKNRSLVRFSTVSLTSFAFRSFDEFAETGAYYQGTIGFRVGKSWTADITAGYSHPFDLDAERPDRWEWEDVTLRAVRPNIWRSKDKSTYISLQMALSLPLSGTSQDASLRAAASVRTPISRRYKKFTFILTPAVVLASHRFETADVFGFQRNSPFGASMGLATRYSITRKLALLGFASIYTFFDYDGNNRNIQTLGLNAQYAFSRNWFGTFGYRWRDRVITNNSVFDDDASRLAGSLTYTF